MYPAIRVTLVFTRSIRSGFLKVRSPLSRTDTKTRLMFRRFAKTLNTTNTKILTGPPGTLDRHSVQIILCGCVLIWRCPFLFSMSLYHHLNGCVHECNEKDSVHVSGQKLHKKTEKNKLIDKFELTKNKLTLCPNQDFAGQSPPCVHWIGWANVLQLCSLCKDFTLSAHRWLIGWSCWCGLLPKKHQRKDHVCQMAQSL